MILEDKPGATADVGATIGQAVEVDVGHPVRKAIQDKARKYGVIDMPFVIAIWPKSPYHFSFGDDDDMVALYGDKVSQVGPSGEVRGAVQPNGVFTIKRNDGAYRYSHVSAVLFCHPDVTLDPPLRVYHNPFATRPVDMDVFKGIPQCTIGLTTGREQWSPQ